MTTLKGLKEMSNWYTKIASRNDLPFYGNCVGWDSEDLDPLLYIIANRVEITYEEFMERTGLDFYEYRDESGYSDYEEEEPYDDDGEANDSTWVKRLLIMPDGSVDWHVEFDELPGYDLVLFRHSAIEYVFADYETISQLSEDIKSGRRSL
jgi:hypothetical protein